MRDELEPIVGKWYLDVELDEPFRIAAIDEERDVIQVRYLDGETEEIEVGDWSDLDLEPAEPPEDEAEDEDKDDSDWREPAAGEADDWDDEEEDDDDWDDEDEDDEIRDDE